MSSHSPAHILRQLLIDDLTVGDHQASDWASVVSNLPDDDSLPDNSVGFYNTGGILDGRLMGTGKVVHHPGVMIRVRSDSDPTAYDKADTIYSRLGTIKREQVTIATETYRIESITVTTDIVFIGESENRARTSYTIDMIMSVTKL